MIINTKRTILFLSFCCLLLLVTISNTLFSLNLDQTGATILISLGVDGNQANGYSSDPSISADGKRIAFESSATNLVPNDTNNFADAFVFDKETGSIQRVSVNNSGEQGDKSVDNVSISNSGQFVIFDSLSNNLSVDDNNVCTNGGSFCRDVFIRDLTSNVTLLVSKRYSETLSFDHEPSSNPSISSNGQFVLFFSESENLVPGDDNNDGDWFIRDMVTEQTEFAFSGFNPSAGGSVNVYGITPDGQHIVYGITQYTQNVGQFIVIYNRASGNIQSHQISNTTSYLFQIQDFNWDAHYVVFTSSNPDLTDPDPPNGVQNVFLLNSNTGTIELVSSAPDGTPGNFKSDEATISLDGRFVSFQSSASNLIPGAFGPPDIYVKDRSTSELSIVSLAPDGSAGDDWSFKSDISTDGRFVAFSSSATNLVDNDTNFLTDIFLRDRCSDGNCGTPIPQLSLESLTFEHRSVNNGQWIEPHLDVTVEGNIVRITVEIRNNDTFDGPAQVNFINAGTNPEQLLGTITQSSFPVGEVTPVSYEWDTSGFAWNTDGSPHTTPIQIKVTVSDISQTNIVDEETAELDVDPKPVILVHGLWSDANTWNSYSGFLQNVRSDWFSYAVGDGQANGVMNTGVFWDQYAPANSIHQNALELHSYVQGIRELKNAWQVDLVAHSMGGLISRYYIQEFMPVIERPSVSRLIMMGTPNGGSQCADWITTIDPKASFPALEQLRTDSLPWFNLSITQRHGVEFSILAGNNWPIPCSFPEGDGVVSVDSALAIPILDNASRTDEFHTSMTGSEVNFTLFVKPRLTGSVGNQTTTSSPSISQNNQAANSNPNLTYGEIIDVLPSQTQVIQLPQLGGTQLNILLSNVSAINASLKNPSGVVVDNIVANSSRANQIFTSMADNNFTTGTYVLELTNTSSETMSIPVAAWVENDPVNLQLTASNIGLQNQDILSSNQVLVSAMFTNAGNPIIGADVTAQLVNENGSEILITLFDDGNHGDVQANDGIYGYVIETLATDTYIVKVQAESNEIIRLTSSLVKVDNLTFLPFLVKQ